MNLCYFCHEAIAPEADWPNDDVIVSGQHAHSGCLADAEDARRRDEPIDA